MDSDILRSTSLRQAMVSFALRRGAGADAEDAVQATLAEAWQKAERPTEPELLRRWLWGILRHKVVDLHRKRSREISTGDFESPTEERQQAAPEPDGVSDMLLWASRNLPQGKDNEQTLDWLLREADGESLEHIARDAALPPARVRKRVSRLREHFRAHWRRDLAALAALGIATAMLVWLWPRPPAPEPMAKEPQEVTPDPRVELRDRAHDACEHEQWQRCLELLDEAARNAQGTEPERAAADRRRATEHLTPTPIAPTPTPSHSDKPKPPHPPKSSSTTPFPKPTSLGGSSL